MPHPASVTDAAPATDPVPGRRPRALLAMHTDLAPKLIDAPTMRRLTTLSVLDPALVADDFGSPAASAALNETEVLISCWGCPPLTEEVLDRAPRLRAVIHAAGSVKHHITDACWRRGIAVTSAASANALPVAEYTVAFVLLAGKDLLRIRDDYRRRRAGHDWQTAYRTAGNYRRTVGVVGASRIGRRVLELLRPHDLELLVHDPYLPPGEAERLGATAVGLDDLCVRSDVVSVHAPELPVTRHLISRERLASMRTGATLINTSRGSLVDQRALTEELVSGRLDAVLDVTVPEVLPAGSPLYDLPNVVLTPHVAGSLGTELHRMAAAAADELERYVTGRPFAHPVSAEEWAHSA